MEPIVRPEQSSDAGNANPDTSSGGDLARRFRAMLERYRVMREPVAEKSGRKGDSANENMENWVLKWNSVELLTERRADEIAILCELICIRFSRHSTHMLASPGESELFAHLAACTLYGSNLLRELYSDHSLHESREETYRERLNSGFHALLRGATSDWALKEYRVENFQIYQEVVQDALLNYLTKSSSTSHSQVQPIFVGYLRKFVEWRMNSRLRSEKKRKDRQKEISDSLRRDADDEGESESSLVGNRNTLKPPLPLETSEDLPVGGLSEPDLVMIRPGAVSDERRALFAMWIILNARIKKAEERTTKKRAKTASLHDERAQKSLPSTKSAGAETSTQALMVRARDALARCVAGDIELHQAQADFSAMGSKALQLLEDSYAAYLLWGDANTTLLDAALLDAALAAPLLLFPQNEAPLRYRVDARTTTVIDALLARYGTTVTALERCATSVGELKVDHFIASNLVEPTIEKEAERVLHDEIVGPKAASMRADARRNFLTGIQELQELSNHQVSRSAIVLSEFDPEKADDPDTFEKAAQRIHSRHKRARGDLAEAVKTFLRENVVAEELRERLYGKVRSLQLPYMPLDREAEGRLLRQKMPSSGEGERILHEVIVKAKARTKRAEDQEGFFPAIQQLWELSNHRSFGNFEYRHEGNQTGHTRRKDTDHDAFSCAHQSLVRASIEYLGSHELSREMREWLLAEVRSLLRPLRPRHSEKVTNA